MNDPQIPKTTWFTRVARKARTIREEQGAGVTLPRVLAFVAARLLADALRHALTEVWDELTRRW